MRPPPAPPRPAHLRAMPPAGLCWAAIAALLAPSTAAHTARDHDRVAHVFDADTVRLDSGIRISIAGIDAAGTRADRRKCAREIESGTVQTRRVRAMLRSAASPIPWLVEAGTGWSRRYDSKALDLGKP